MRNCPKVAYDALSGEDELEEGEDGGQTASPTQHQKKRRGGDGDPLPDEEVRIVRWTLCTCICWLRVQHNMLV